MDRSFLSQPAVIAASRDFVCVRLTTYEDPDEAKFLKTLVRTKSGEVENSSFAVLSPDTKEKLVRAGRGMSWSYEDAKEMADGMKKLMTRFHPKGEPAALPLVVDVRLSVGVAASDNQPLVLIVADEADQRSALEGAVAKLAWNPDFIGRFVYVSANDFSQLSKLDGLRPGSKLLVIQPDKFGMKGKVLAQTADTASVSLGATLAAGVKAFVPETKTFQNHVREGQREGVFWETKTPVTDPEEKAARARGRRP